MSNKIKMMILVLFTGVLLVSIVLLFIALGLGNPIPWVLLVILIAMPFVLKKNDEQHFVVWKDEYSVGIQSLDNDHKKLLHLINQLHTCIHYQTDESFEKEILDELVAYTKYHFSREEDLMEQAGCEDLDAHKKEHVAMIEKVEVFMADYENQGHEALDSTANYLKDWLLQHINGTDQGYGALMKEKGIV